MQSEFKAEASDFPVAPPLKSYLAEDWATFVFFWALALTVFLQFFTRYVLNDSLAWTEEIARYELICVTFIGASVAVRKNTHIHVEFFYIYFPLPLARALSTLVDVIRTAFYAVCTYLSWQVAEIMKTQQMVVIDWPLSYLYWIVLVGFAAMTFRSVQVSLHHWRTQDSLLIRTHTEGRHQ